MNDNLRDRIAAAIDDTFTVYADFDAQTAADVALATIQGAYVPPPPGSDRDKLPDHLLAVAASHMPPYTSTACQMADALEAAAGEQPELVGELREWAQRMRSSCRITRKQDMAACQHPQHREGDS